MTTNRMLKAALYYHEQDHLNVIPVIYQNKMPALPAWEEYQTRTSTHDEIIEWFGNGRRFNIGLVHCETPSGHYATLDIDHDAGAFIAIKELFPELCTGRLEQSGSGEGYHIPLMLNDVPDFNARTWKTPLGSVNARINACQTVAPPSVHPSGKPYKFLRWGDIVRLPTLTPLMNWLDELAPPKPQAAPAPSKRRNGTATGDTLVDLVKSAWDTLDVFQHWGRANEAKRERNGEMRLGGNGGLLISNEDETSWYCFEHETGGGVIEAWGFCRYGSVWDKRRHFRETLLEMAHAAGLDVARFYRRGDEQVAVNGGGDTGYWTGQFRNRWESVR